MLIVSSHDDGIKSSNLNLDFSFQCVPVNKQTSTDIFLYILCFFWPLE